MRICRRGGYVAPSGAEVRLPSTEEVLKASVFYQNPPRVDSIVTAETSVCDAVNDDWVAAINRPDLTSDGRLVDWAVVATKKKIRTMLRIGLLHGHDAIVLGAWGCGAFCNPPEHMARLFHEVLEEDELARKYRIVRFAVIEDHNSRHSNFAPFDREFNRGPARIPAAPNN